VAIHASLYEFATAAAHGKARRMTGKYIRRRPDPRESKTKARDLFHYRTWLIWPHFIPDLSRQTREFLLDSSQIAR
jgi:hypothetical protein